MLARGPANGRNSRAQVYWQQARTMQGMVISLRDNARGAEDAPGRRKPRGAAERRGILWRGAPTIPAVGANAAVPAIADKAVAAARNDFANMYAAGLCRPDVFVSGCGCGSRCASLVALTLLAALCVAPDDCNKRRVTEFSSSSVLPTPGAATRRRLNPLSLRGREREPPAAAGGMAVRPGPRPTHDVMENLPSFKGTHDPRVCSPPGSIPCAVRAAAVARPSASRVVGIRGCGRTGAGARDVARAPGQQQLAGGRSGSSDPALAPFPGSRIHAVPRRCAGCTTACCWRVRILTRRSMNDGH